MRFELRCDCRWVRVQAWVERVLNGATAVPLQQQNPVMERQGECRAVAPYCVCIVIKTVRLPLMQGVRRLPLTTLVCLCARASWSQLLPPAHTCHVLSRWAHEGMCLYALRGEGS